MNKNRFIVHMGHQRTKSGLQGIAIVLFGLQLTVVDVALFPDSGSLLVIGAAIIALFGVIHSFKPLLKRGPLLPE